MTKKNDIITSTESNILTPRELAEKMKVGEKVVLSWARNGMPHLRVNYKTIRFEWDKVQTYLERGNK